MYGKSSEEFITQETPYIFKKDTVMSPSGAGTVHVLQYLLCVYVVPFVEVSFDSGRFVAVDIPDENSITSSTSAGVAVGNLLVRGEGAALLTLLGVSASQDSGELLAKEEVAPSILLNPNATLSPADFERKWLNMKIRYCICVRNHLHNLYHILHAYDYTPKLAIARLISQSSIAITIMYLSNAFGNLHPTNDYYTLFLFLIQNRSLIITFMLQIRNRCGQMVHYSLKSVLLVS